MAEDRPSPNAASAATWSSVAFGVRQGAQLLALMILARLLAPEEFGVFAMAMVVTGLALVLRDLGAGAAAIQDASPDQTLLSSLFWLAATSAAALAAIVVILAPAVAELFAQPALADVLPGLAIGLAVGGLGVVPQALLERRLRFRAIAVAEALAGGVALVASVAAAISGLGVGSLVVLSVVQVTVLTVTTMTIGGWLPRAAPSRAALRRGGRYGLPVAGFSVLNYLARNADNALIGRFLGATQLGYYAVAYRLMLLPVQVVNAVANRVLFPILARLHDKPHARRSAYLSGVLFSSMVALPVAAGLAGAADIVIRVLYGPGWEPAVPVLRLLAIVAVAQVVGATVGPIFLATGRTDRLLLWGIVSSVVIVASFIVGLPFGITGVAAAYAVASAALFLPSLAVGLPLIGVRVADLLRRMAPEFVAAVAVGVLAWGLGTQLQGALGVVTLAVQVAICVPVYVGALWILDRPGIVGAASYLRRRGAPA
jgi:PST family polysaccharide transporter